MRTVAVLRMPIPRVRWSFNSLVASLSGLALAISIVSRAFHFTGRTLSRVEWLLAFAVIAGFSSWLIANRDWKYSIKHALAAIGMGTVWTFASIFSVSGYDSNLWIFGSRMAVVGQWLPLFTDAIVGSLIGFVVIDLFKRFLWPTPDRTATPISWAIPCVGAVAIVAYAVSYHHRERWVPFWDYGFYWSLSAELSESNSLHEAAIAIRESVATHEYNLLPAIVPAIVMKLLGSSWMVYLATVAAIYGSINFIAQRWISDRLLGPATSFSTAIWPTLLAVTCPILGGAMFRGYLDLGGVALGLVALGIYLARPAHELSMRDGVILGICLAGLFLYRRWYTIWAVAFVATAGMEWLIAMASQKPKMPWMRMRAMVVAGVVAAGIVISFAWPILRRVLFNNYSEAYTAYRLDGDNLDRLNAFFRTIGYGTVILFATSVLIGLCFRETRRLTLFGTMLTVIMHVLFHRIQDLGPHHKLLYMPTYLMIVGAAGRIVLGRFPRAIFPIAGGLVFAFLLAFEPSLDAIRRRLVPVAPEHPIYPVVRHDLPAIERAIQRANDEARSRHTRFAVIASSTTINQYLVKNFHRAMRFPAPDDWRLQLFPEVDKTGWYPKELFEADVYLVADPVQLHLPAPEQQIVGIATEMFMQHVGIGASCREIDDPIKIDNGVSLRLFVRERAITDDERNQFRDRLKAAHPNWVKLHDVEFMEPRTK